MIAATTLDNTPRDPQHIAGLPMSHQYKIAHQLGILNTEDAKSAFHALTKEQRGAEVYNALLEHDKKGGPNMNAQNPQMPLPMQPQQQQGPMPMMTVGQPTYQQTPGQIPVVMQPGPMPAGMMPQVPRAEAPGPQGYAQQFAQPPGNYGGPSMPMGQPQMPPAAPVAQHSAHMQQGSVDAAAQIQQLAEAMRSMTAAQERLNGLVDDLTQRLAGSTRIASISLMVLIAYIESDTKVPRADLMNWYRAQVANGFDKQLVNEVLTVPGK